MGMSTFVKVPSGDMEHDPIGFDSSPQYSIPKMIGIEPKSMRLELIDTSNKGQKFNVYGASVEGGVATIRGTLFVESAEEWRRRMHRGGYGR